MTNTQIVFALLMFAGILMSTTFILFDIVCDLITRSMRWALVGAGIFLSTCVVSHVALDLIPGAHDCWRILAYVWFLLFMICLHKAQGHYRRNHPLP